MNAGNRFANLVIKAIAARNTGSGLEIAFQGSGRDSFGRARVSHPATIVESHHVRDSNEAVITEQVTGSGTSVYDSASSSMLLQVTGVGTVVRQTRRRGIYLPGKSLLVLCTGVLNAATNDSTVTSRIGYYDNSDGIYIEYQNGLNIVKRSSTSGSVVETRVSQENWNMKTLTGTESDDPAIDPSKTIIFFVELEWLGAGYATLGCIINGTHHYLHRFRHSNIEQSTYIRMATQPVRYELISTAGNGSLRQICTAVLSEGGSEPIGRAFSASNGVVTRGADDIITPILSIQLKTSASAVTIRPIDFNVLCASKADSLLSVYLFRDTEVITVLTGSSFNSVHGDSAVEVDTAATAINTAGGELIATQYFSNNVNTRQLSGLIGENISLTTNLTGQSDLLVLCVQSVAGTTKQYVATMSWVEQI